MTKRFYVITIKLKAPEGEDDYIHEGTIEAETTSLGAHSIFYTAKQEWLRQHQEKYSGVINPNSDRIVVSFFNYWET